MKNTILKLFVICLLVQSHSTISMASAQSNNNAEVVIDANAGASNEDKIDAYNAQMTINEDTQLSDDDYQKKIDIEESGGDVFNNYIPKINDLKYQEHKSILEVDEIKDIDSINNIQDLQKDVELKVSQSGTWAVNFIYIGNNGTKTPLSSLRTHEPIKPASSMKLMTSYLSFVAGTYPLDKMSDMLHRSDNGMADQAFRTVSKNKPSFVLPDNSYARSLIGYKIRDGAEKTNRVIDAAIAKSCVIASNTYISAGLTDALKLHFVNGSGLQNTAVDKGIFLNKVTVNAQTELLEKILQSGRYNEYKKLLAQPGQYGTLHRRLSNMSGLAKIYAKTGTLGSTKALVGFAETKHGTIVFSMIGDDLSISPASAAKIEDRILSQHVSYLTARGM